MRAGETPTSDLDLYDRLSELASEELEATDLWQYRDRLADAEFEALKRRQQAVWKARDEERPLPPPAERDLKAAVRDLGTDDADGGAVRGYFRRHRERALDEAAQERGIEVEAYRPTSGTKSSTGRRRKRGRTTTPPFPRPERHCRSPGPWATEETIRQAASAQLTGGPEALAAFVNRQGGISGGVGDDVLLGGDETPNGKGGDTFQTSSGDLLDELGEYLKRSADGLSWINLKDLIAYVIKNPTNQDVQAVLIPFAASLAAAPEAILPISAAGTAAAA